MTSRHQINNEADASNQHPLSSVKSDVEMAIASQDWIQALRLLHAANDRSFDRDLEQRLIDVSIRAYRAYDWPAPTISWPPGYTDHYPQCASLLEVDRAELSTNAIRAGINGHGGLIVRSLMDSETVEAMRDNIDRAFAAQADEVSISTVKTLRRWMGAFAAQADGNRIREANLPWFRTSPEIDADGPAQFGKRGSKDKSTDTGAVWAAHSPRSAAQMMRFYRAINLPTMLHEYFGEPATLCVKKWVLRCVGAEPTKKSGWHQDGRLWDDDIKVVNLWVTLTECGGNASAPGIEMVSGSNQDIYESGTGDARFSWTVGQEVVDQISDSKPIVCPHLHPGDAIFFDHLNLHRTCHVPHETRNRYAVESWFFAASDAMEKMIPIVL